MSNFDDEISTTLSTDDRAFLDNLENGRGLFEQLGATLQGPMRFWSYMMGVLTFIFFAAALYCGWHAFHAEQTRNIILWSVGFLLLFQMVGFLKMWLFDRMNLLSMLAELKKIELRLVQISERK